VKNVCSSRTHLKTSAKLRPMALTWTRASPGPGGAMASSSTRVMPLSAPVLFTRHDFTVSEEEEEEEGVEGGIAGVADASEARTTTTPRFRAGEMKRDDDDDDDDARARRARSTEKDGGRGGERADDGASRIWRSPPRARCTTGSRTSRNDLAPSLTDWNQTESIGLVYVSRLSSKYQYQCATPLPVSGTPEVASALCSPSTSDTPDPLRAKRRKRSRG